MRKFSIILAAVVVAAATGKADAAASVSVDDTAAPTYSFDVNTDDSYFSANIVLEATSGAFDLGSFVPEWPTPVAFPPANGFSILGTPVFTPTLIDFNLAYSPGNFGPSFFDLLSITGTGSDLAGTLTVSLFSTVPESVASASFGAAPPAIPEPASLLVFAGLAGVVGMRRVR